MSPLDDELRDLLAARATGVAPPPDPFAGIEARARGIRRRRAAAAVTGAALAVGAVTLAVPALTGGQRAAAPDRFATSGPTAGTPYALDPARPWAYRGDPRARVLQEPAAAVWRHVHHVTGGLFALLDGQVYEPSGKAEAVYVATVGGRSWWGVAQEAPGGPRLARDEPLAAGTVALVARLAGDEVPRLLVVSAPGSTVELSSSRGTLRADGTGRTIPSFPLEGATARLRVLAADGAVLLDEAAASETAEPSNVLAWPARGTAQPDLVDAARSTLAAALGTPGGPVELRVLFSGADGHGNRFVTGQVWAAGAAAASGFAYAVDAAGRAEPFLGRPTPSGAELLAFAIAQPQAGATLLVVIPSPRTTQVEYAPDRRAGYRALVGRPTDDGVVVVQRHGGNATARDRLRLLTGNGAVPSDVTFEGSVAPLLCGVRECG